MTTSVPAWQKREDLFIVPRGGWLLAGTLLLSVALVGGRPLWAQGIVTAGIGLLWLLYPPTKTPSRAVLWALGLLAVAPLAAYLPGAWLAMPAWRTSLLELPALEPSFFVSPQPWYTFHTWLLWLAGVALAGWCASQNWDHYNRDTLARMYAGGIVGLTLYAIFGYSAGANPSLWVSTDGFGPFANRNQWGSAMGMAGIMALAILHQSVRHAHKRGVIFWAVSLVILTGAIIANGSRGGLIVLVVGGFAYWMFFGLARKEYRYAAIALSFLLIFFALFSLGGGPLLERFVGTLHQGIQGDRRIDFYRMTLAVVRDAPLAGFGLGNFEFVFPFYLNLEAIADTRPVHPENSFIWLASEGGWLLVAVVAAAFAILLQHGYSARRSRATTIRSAGLACALMMILNAFFEVSAHRIGALFPSIFLASLALPAATGPALVGIRSLLLRVGGGGLVLIGLLWIVSAFGWPLLPAAQGTFALRELAGREHAAGRPSEAIALLRQSADLKPLDWDTHWALAAYYLGNSQPDEAWNEFRAVEMLLPYMDSIVEQEGYFWLSTNAARAAYAWNRALQRASAGRRPDKYGGFLRQAKDNPGLEALLLRLYPEDPVLEFTRLRHAAPQGDGRLARLLRMTDNLAVAPDHLVPPVLRHMQERGLTAEIRTMTERSPRLRRLGWRQLANIAAQQQNLPEALDLHFQFAPRPALPAPISRSDLRSIERTAALAPMDIATAIAYYQALDTARRRDEAFWQLRRIMELPNAPAYIWYLAARAAHERGEHDEAWAFLQAFEQKSKP